MPASATPAFALYTEGKYAQAIEDGIAQNTAAGFAVAARAELAQEMMRDTPCLACLKRAEDYARRAVASDPKSVEGHIEIAVALGYEARIVGKFAAHFNHFAEQAKQNLDSALAVDPGSEWALAATGGWNIEIVRGGGSTLAHWLYGADVETGLADFAKAFAGASDSLLLHYQYALVLAGYDRDKYRNAIEDALSRTLADKPQSSFEAFAQTRARMLQQAFLARDWEDFDREVRHDQGYP